MQIVTQPTLPNNPKNAITQPKYKTRTPCQTRDPKKPSYRKTKHHNPTYHTSIASYHSASNQERACAIKLTPSVNNY